MTATRPALSLTLLLADGKTVKVPRDFDTYPRLRLRIAAYEAATGATVRIAG